jgi:hypothetical protein
MDILRTFCGDYEGYSPQSQELFYAPNAENKGSILRKALSQPPRSVFGVHNLTLLKRRGMSLHVILTATKLIGRLRPSRHYLGAAIAEATERGKLVR